MNSIYSVANSNRAIFIIAPTPANAEQLAKNYGFVKRKAKAVKDVTRAFSEEGPEIQAMVAGSRVGQICKVGKAAPMTDFLGMLHEHAAGVSKPDPWAWVFMEDAREWFEKNP